MTWNRKNVRTSFAFGKQPTNNRKFFLEMEEKKHFFIVANMPL